MENTTYYIQKELDFINTIIFDENIYKEFKNYYIISFNSIIFDDSRFKNEIDTYIIQNKEFIINDIYETTKLIIYVYENDEERNEFEKNHEIDLENYIKEYKKNKDIDILEFLKIDIINYGLMKKYKYVFTNLDEFEFLEKVEFLDEVELINDNTESYKYTKEYKSYEFINYCKRVINYIDSIRGQSKEKELKIKTLNLNEYNKPVFTQKQISILFKIFKEKNIISNTYLTDTDFSKIICSLTGYSDETIRQNLSKEFKVISDKKTDYEKIISKLTEIINELRRQIK